MSEEPHKVVYAAPTREALAALLRRHAVRITQLAGALSPDLDADAIAAGGAEAVADVESRTALHRMVMDLAEQVRRCESAAGLVRQERPGVARCGDRV
jgi:hypothetical protein